MSTATLLVLSLLGAVLNRPGPHPGADALVEGVKGTAQFSGSDQQKTITLSLEGDYTETADMWIGVSVRKSATSSTPSGPGKIDTKITSLSTGSVDVQVDTETAPGSGSSYTIEASIVVIGHANA